MVSAGPPLVSIIRLGRLMIGAAILFAVGWLSVSVYNSHFMTLIVGGPRVDLPFAAGRKGEAVEARFHVPRDEYFAFTLDLYFKPGDQQDRSKIQKMAGSGARHPDGRTVDDGISIPVKLTISRSTSEGETTLVQKEITDEPLESYGAAFSKTVYGTVLQKGDYRVRIEALEDVPELTDVPVNFDVRIPGNLK